jgi:sulfite reductase (NADPH) hemoprotein beta-component
LFAWSAGYASIGKILGPALREHELVEAVEKVLGQYLACRDGHDETFLECYRRLGPEPFRQAAYQLERSAA